MGEGPFSREAVAAGVDGVIVPDMPPEEAEPLWKASESEGPCLVFLLAPTSTATRKAQVIHRTRGFIYYVSLTGITGAKLQDLTHVRVNVEDIRKKARKPIAVGFGISTPDDARQVAEFADGVIVGSAFVRLIGDSTQNPDFVERVGQFTRELKEAIVF